MSSSSVVLTTPGGRRLRIHIGSFVRIRRPRYPFVATVVRINKHTLTVRDGFDKEWRVPLTYPVSIAHGDEGAGKERREPFGVPKATRPKKVKAQRGRAAAKPKNKPKSASSQKATRPKKVKAQRGRTAAKPKNKPKSASSQKAPRRQRGRRRDSVAAPATRRSGLSGRAALDAIKALAAQVPRDSTLPGPGQRYTGGGFSGWIWAKVPGAREEIVLSSNFGHTGAALAAFEARVRQTVPGVQLRRAYD